MAIVHLYYAVYPSGATDPIGDDPYGDPAASYEDTDTALASCLAQVLSDTSGNLTTGGVNNPNSTVVHIEIIPSDGSWNGAPDTNTVTLDGWKTDKSTDGSYIEIKTYGSARSSDGLWDTSAYILQVTSTGAGPIRVDNDASSSNYLDVEFEGIQFEQRGNGAGDGYHGFVINSSAYHKWVLVHKCLFRQSNVGDPNDAAFYDLDTSGCVTRLKNCIIGKYSGFSGHGILLTRSSGNVLIYNCTVYGTDSDAIEDNDAGAGIVTIVNVANFANADDWQDFTNTVPNYCAFDDTDTFSNDIDISPTDPELTAWHSAFTDPDTDDVTVTSTDSCLYHAGYNQTADSEVPSDDIIGTTRPSGSSAVTVGAFEYVVAAGDIYNEALVEALGLTSCLPPFYNHFTRGQVASLATDNDDDLSTIFSCADYEAVRADDDSYVTLDATAGFAEFQFKVQHISLSDPFEVTVKPKSNVAFADSAVYLQILNRNSSTWETLDYDDSTPAGSEATLTGQKTSSLSNYIDANKWVSLRVYQAVG